MTKKIKIIIVVVIVLILGGVFYFLSTKKDVPVNKLISSNLGSSDPLTGATSNSDTDFLNRLDYLKSMKLDVGIFINSSFKSLKDNTVVIEFDGVVGRKNPFVPIFTETQPIVQNTIINDVNNPSDLKTPK